MTFRPTGWVLYTLLSLLGVPTLVYVFGRLLAGPYEGKFGLLGLMGNIYGAALLGSVGAWLVLLAPLLLVGIWWGSFALCRRLGDTADATNAPQRPTRRTAPRLTGEL